MNATTFDTYAAAKRLRDAGFDEHQAEAAVSMVREAVGADRDQLARKADIANLEVKLAQLEARLTNRLYAVVFAAVLANGLIATVLKLL